MSADELPPLVSWFFDQYRDSLDVKALKGSRRYKQFLKNADAEKTWQQSGFNRYQSFQLLKFSFPLSHAGYIACSYAMRLKGSEPVIYSFAYWPGTPDAVDVDTDPEYVCVSPTYVSQDGEFRSRFVRYDRMTWSSQEYLAETLALAEETVLTMISNGDLEVVKTRFSHNGDLRVEPGRLGVELAATAIAVDGARARDSTLAAHTNELYATTVATVWRRAVAHTDQKFDPVAEFRADWAEGDESGFIAGQKLRPLTIREVLEPESIEHASWRELWINQIASDLVINRIAPMFPLFGNWTAVDGGSPAMFDGAPMRSKFARSDQAVKVVQQLRTARSEVDPASAQTDYLVGQFDVRIHEPIVFAQSRLIMAGATLLTTQEVVGHTFGSMATVLKQHSRVSPAHLRTFADMGPRTIFDLCYGAHALHTRAGCVHGDLHLNNATLFEFDMHLEPLDPPQSIAYVAGSRGEADTYVFPHEGAFASIIDFSRAIVGPGARDRVIASEGKAAATAFFRNQLSRILRVLHHYVPTFAEQRQEKIKALALGDPEAFFRALTAVDYLAIGRNFGALFRRMAANPIATRAGVKVGVSAEAIAIAKRIEKLALRHLIRGLTEPNSVASAAGTAGASIIPAVFEPWQYSESRASSATLVDAYNINAPLQYSGSKYKDFPPWARLDQVEEHISDSSGLDVADVTGRQGPGPFLAVEAASDLALLDLQARVGADATDAPAAETSSWIGGSPAPQRGWRTRAVSRIE